MTRNKIYAWSGGAAVAVAAVASAVVLASSHGGNAGPVPRAPVKFSHVGRASITKDSGMNGSATGRSVAAAPIKCGMGESAFGYIGVVRPGYAAAARHALGARLLAQVTDSATGKLLDLARTSHVMDPATGKPVDLGQMDPATVSELFSQWSPVYPQARESQLLSCNMTLSDRPADQPLIASAITAVTRSRYAKSAATLRSQLQEVLVSDNPSAANSVIVTLLVPGAAYPNPARGGPVLHHLAAYTALENEFTAQVTGVTAGGF